MALPEFIDLLDIEENKGYGRVERRVVLAINAIDWMDKQEIESWLGLQSIENQCHLILDMT